MTHSILEKGQTGQALSHPPSLRSAVSVGSRSEFRRSLLEFPIAGLLSALPSSGSFSLLASLGEICGVFRVGDVRQRS